MAQKNWIHRHALEVAIFLTALCFALQWCLGGEISDLMTPECSSRKCPYETMGIFLEGECWCITKPDP